jgi:TonB family C-terminal domain
MINDFNLMSQRWLDLIFKDKNRMYGAYELRDTSSDRHLKALVIVTIVGLSVLFLPNLIKSVIPQGKKITVTEEIAMAVVELDQEIPEENQIKEIENVPPPPLLKETVAFTPPKVVKDEEVKDEELMLQQDELTDTQADISIANVEGVKDGGIDIADLEEHKVIVQVEEDENKIHEHVEVQPEFPGGYAELMKWLNDNLEYPVIAAEQGTQGVVNMRFVVQPDGSVGKVEVVKPLDPSCDKEAIRVLSKMPKWIPGKQNGKAVNVWFNLPVRFRLGTN